MTDILVEMEHRHSTSSREAFSKWWDEDGAMRRYFDLKGKAERIEQILFCSVIEEEEYPKMRTKAVTSDTPEALPEQGFQKCAPRFERVFLQPGPEQLHEEKVQGGPGRLHAERLREEDNDVGSIDGV